MGRIGFFDSGVGGLTVAEAVRELIPMYDTIYLGDTVNSPYGNKEHNELVTLLWTGVEWLFKNDCELVIVACNSASASALREVQQTKLSAYPNKRVLGVIRPTAEELSRYGYKKVLVLSTVATAASGAYEREFVHQNPDLLVHVHACPKWASMVERGLAGTEEMRAEVEREMARAEATFPDYDAVLLACTHYPYLKTDIERAMTVAAPVFEQGSIVAASLVDYLSRHANLEVKLGRTLRRSYFVTGDTALATRVATEAFGYAVNFSTTSLC